MTEEAYGDRHRVDLSVVDLEDFNFTLPEKLIAFAN
jgi:hypothetical protein